MMAVAFGPASCSSVLVPKSELLGSPEEQHDLFQNTALMMAKTSPFGLKKEDKKTRCNSELKVGLLRTEILQISQMILFG
jgi:hypothetical protein